jgi:hypothetical protein
MAVAYAIDNAFQLPADTADVIVSQTETISHRFLNVFTPVLSDRLLWHVNSARLCQVGDLTRAAADRK